jgi:hypothetical protein
MKAYGNKKNKKNGMHKMPDGSMMKNSAMPKPKPKSKVKKK